ncbi:MAG: glycosyltransferase [Rubinisphaera brasiliensis]|uniref:glycosyltransferase n=1 Tax=Rubinisphaera brasiliensis TaxID=119 RepID=UPI00391DCAD5
MNVSPPPRPIAFCITELDPGGAEQALLQIVSRLDRSRWDPLVICLAGRGPLVEEFERAGIPVRCLGARGKRNLSVLFRLISTLRQHRPVLLQTFLFHANLLGRVAVLFAGRPRVVSGIRVAERRSRWYLRLDRWTDWLVDRHACVSTAVARFSEQVGRLNRRKLVVIPNGVDVTRFEAAVPATTDLPAVGEGEKIALYVGRLDQQKGVDLLPEIAKSLRKKGSQLQWLIVGEGAMRGELEQRIKHNSLDNMHLLGRRNNIPALMRRADLFVFPSRWEGMPNAILEAMAAGLPIVSTAVEGIDELLDDGESARITPCDDVTAMSTAVEELLTDPAKQQAFAEAAQKTVRERFSWDQVAADYERLYARLLGEE